MRNILLPTDFSQNAKNAIVYALSLYGHTSVHYVLFNSFYIPYSSPDVAVSMGDFTAENAEKAFNQLLDELASIFPGVVFDLETEFRVGDVAETASSMVKRKKIDLIVMGTQGASGLQEVLIGSHTSSVIRKVDCPVLAIPQNSRFTPIKTILLAINLADEKTITQEMLAPVLDLEKQYKAEIMALYVVEDEKQVEAGKKRLEELLEGTKHSFHRVYAEKVVDGIETFVETHEVSMLALVRPKYSFFERLFHRSVTKKMALHTKVPLLVLHA